MSLSFQFSALSVGFLDAERGGGAALPAATPIDLEEATDREVRRAIEAAECQ